MVLCRNKDCATFGETSPILVSEMDTDSNGSFTIGEVPGGAYELAAKEFHYLRGISKPITIPPSATNVTFDCQLPGSPNNALRGGDCNNDNVVNLQDFNILAMFFGEAATPPATTPGPGDPPSAWHADIDGSGVVDMDDLAILASNFGEAGVPGGVIPAETVLDDGTVSGTEIKEPVEPSSIEADVDIDLDTLNLNSKRRWITCYIELPEGYDVEDIDATTVVLKKDDFEVGGEYGEFRTGKLVVRFLRPGLQSILEPGDVELTVSGELTDGTLFEGTDTITVLKKGGKKD